MTRPRRAGGNLSKFFGLLLVFGVWSTNHEHNMAIVLKVVLLVHHEVAVDVGVDLAIGRFNAAVREEKLVVLRIELAEGNG